MMCGWISIVAVGIVRLALEHGWRHFNTQDAYCWRRDRLLFSTSIASQWKQNSMPSFIRAAASHCLFGAMLALIIPSTLARADTYPSKPVRIIVPYGAGGIADVTMPLLAVDPSKT